MFKVFDTSLYLSSSPTKYLKGSNSLSSYSQDVEDKEEGLPTLFFNVSLSYKYYNKITK